MERLGLSITMVQGRHLSAEEREEARKRHGGKQIAIASTRHLSVPRHLADSLHRLSEKTDHLPIFKEFLTLLNFRRTHQSKPDGLPATKPRRKTAKPPRSDSPRPLALQRLSAKLSGRLPFLRTIRHLGAVTDALTEANIDPEIWTASTLIAELDGLRKAKGWDTPNIVKNPLGWFRWLLQGISPTAQERRRQYLKHQNAEVEQRRRSAMEAAQRAAQARAEAQNRADSIKAGSQMVRDYLRSLRT